MDVAPSGGRHAVVLGASLAGLLTARVLSNHFERVTVVERDPVGEQPESRKGQPQTRHLHGLLYSGLQIMTKYFPSLPADLRAGGAVVADFGDSMRWYTHGGYRQRFHAGIEGAAASRPFLEALVRQQTLARSQVSLRDARAVAGLVASEDRGRITGVRLERRGDGGESLPADLVVDCSGRGSRLPQWLEELGYARPSQSEVKVDVGYATRTYHRDPADPRGQQFVLITPEAPAQTRFGGMFAIEGDRWIVSLGGWAGDHGPVDESDYLAFARTLFAPDIYDVISRAEPLTDIVPYKFPASLRRHYEKTGAFPDGLLVLGDAVASLNPTYGQGMTLATMQAAALDALLAERQGSIEGLAPAHFKQAAAIVDAAWQLAVGEDFRFPQTSGPKPPGTDLTNRYVTLVHRATTVDPEVCRQFVKVMNLVALPTSLMAPRMLLRVLLANRRLPSRHGQPRRPEVVSAKGA